MLSTIYTVFNCYTGQIYFHTRFKPLANLFAWFNGHQGTDFDDRDNIYFEDTDVLQNAIDYWYAKDDIAYASKLIQELTTRPDFKKSITKKRKTFQRKRRIENAKKAKVQNNA